VSGNKAVHEIFRQALALEDDERERFVSQQSAGDVELECRVRLLRVYLARRDDGEHRAMKYFETAEESARQAHDILRRAMPDRRPTSLASSAGWRPNRRFAL
jgi:hypothetical protein